MDLTVSMHLEPMEQLTAMKMVKGKVSDIDRMKIAVDVVVSILLIGTRFSPIVSELISPSSCM